MSVTSRVDAVPAGICLITGTYQTPPLTKDERECHTQPGELSPLVQCPYQPAGASMPELKADMQFTSCTLPAFRFTQENAASWITAKLPLHVLDVKSFR